jgi:DNA-binding transcriptional LysR family regulator
MGMRDLVEALIMPGLLASLQASAPGVRWSTLQVPRRDMEIELAAGRLDLAFDVLLPLSPRVRQQKLIEDHYVVLARKCHPLLRRGLTLERYLHARHIAVSSRSSGPALEDFELSRLGYRRDVVLRCQHFFVARQTVAQTDLLLTLPSRYARQAGFAQDLRVLPLPIALPPLAVHLYWHESREDDAGNRWLRDQVVSVAGNLIAH